MTMGERIRALELEAISAGDLAMAAVCGLAIGGSPPALEQCQRVLAYAEMRKADDSSE